MTELQQLLAVQELDTKADQLAYRKSHLPESITLRATEAAIAALEAEAASAQAIVNDLAKQQADLETAIEVMRTKRANLGTQLSKSVVPKEAESLQSEIAGIRQRLSQFEDQELALMEQSEPVEARLASIAAQRIPLESRRATEADALAAAIAVVDAELTVVVSDRVTAVATVAPRLLERYEKMRKHLGGVAVARIHHGTCLGCNTQLSSTEREAAAAAAADEMIECENCGRLLVR